MTKAKDFELTEHKGDKSKTLHMETGKIEEAKPTPQIGNVSVEKVDPAIAARSAMHHDRPLSEEEREQVKTIKDEGARFFEYCDRVGQSLELSVAKTKIQEAVMWAVWHITRPL